MSEKTKATIFETRREMLLQSVVDKRTAYVATDTMPPMAPIYGLAVSEHQFLLAVAQSKFAITKISKADLQRMMAEELAGEQ